MGDPTADEATAEEGELLLALFCCTAEGRLPSTLSGVRSTLPDICATVGRGLEVAAWVFTLRNRVEELERVRDTGLAGPEDEGGPPFASDMPVARRLR